MIKRLPPLWTLAVFIGGLLFLGAVPASAQIRVIIANPVEEAIVELAEEFETRHWKRCCSGKDGHERTKSTAGVG